MPGKTGVGRFQSRWRPTCSCRRCRARRVRRTPRIVESTLIAPDQRGATSAKKRSWVLAASAGLLALMLFLLAGMGMLWDRGPLAPLLFRPTATVTIVPTRLERQATLVITAVTGTPDAARQEVAARFISTISPVQMARGRASGVAHIPATAAWGNLTFYNAATYSQTIAEGTVLTGADGVLVVIDAPALIPAGNPPLFGIASVNAHAAVAGSRGNIAVLDINGLCCAAGVAVKNTAAFTGGQDSRTYPTVMQADIDGLAHPLVETLSRDAQAGVRSQLRPQEWMVTVPTCTPAINVDHAVGSRAAQVTVAIAVTCRGEVYDQQAARLFASVSFTRQSSATLGANYAPVGKVTTALVGVGVTDTKRGTLALSLEVRGAWVYRWNLAYLKTLARRIAGTSKQEALAFVLREEGVQTASLHLAGSEQTRLPTDPSRIIISVAGEQPVAS